MKVEVEDVSSVRRKIHVELPAEVVDEAFEDAYRELKKTARLRGFRPGKAPRSLLERYYGDQVKYDVSTKLFQESYTKSLQEKDLNPVSQPNIENLEIRPGADFRYTALVEVKPEVEVTDYMGLEVNREEVRVSDKQVQGRLEEIREMFAHLEDVEEDRPVQEGDVILATQQLSIMGEPLAEGAPQENMLEVRPDRLEDGIFKALVGMREGDEKEVAQKFPSDHPDPRLSGREGVLKIGVKSIRRKILPELDDDLARRLGEFTTIEDLRVRVREQLEEAERQRIKADMNRALMDQLLERYPVEVPEAMVELQIQQMIRDTQRRLAVHGMTIEQTGGSPEQMRVRFRDSAARAVRTELILEAIARREGIQATEEDLNEAYQKIAEQTGRDTNTVKSAYQDPGALESLKINLLEELTLDFLRDKANIIKKKRRTKSKKE